MNSFLIIQYKLQNKNITMLVIFLYGGDNEIRTHAPITRPNTLAGCPLNHLSTSPSYIKHYILFG